MRGKDNTLTHNTHYVTFYTYKSLFLLAFILVQYYGYYVTPITHKKVPEVYQFWAK